MINNFHILIKHLSQITHRINMYSKVYAGAIRFCQNNDDCFITHNIDSKIHEKSIKPLSEGHPDAAKYVRAVQKLFSEISINQSNLWIIPTIGTDSVRIYFSDPIMYPVSSCCQKCVYVDIETNLNGSIICPSCNIILASFIHYFEGNQIGDFSQLDKQALFRQKKRQNEMKNRLLYQNLTSNKFKTKNLKKVLLNHSKIMDQTIKFNSTGDSSMFKKEVSGKQRDITGKGTRDGFIVQIRASTVKQNKHMDSQKYFGFNNIAINNKATSVSKYEQETKRQFDHQLSIEETRKIIMDIFK